jgi:hypothetical protein
MLALRLSVLALAVVACAWFAVGVIQSHDQTEAEALLQRVGTPTPATTASIMSLLSTAGTVNPDRNIELDRSQAQSRAGQAQAGVATAERVATAEPQNVNAWLVLGFAAGRVEPGLARRARAKVMQLAPPVPRRR